MTRMPMFPLGSVLVPHQPLPLHVFEPRYRALVHDCLAGDGTFGVVLIERGNEVGGGDVRFDVGAEARIVQAEEQPDGRWHLVAVGTRRIRVDAWLPDDPYPLADVTVADEQPWSTADDGAMATALAAFARVLDVAGRLGMAVPSDAAELRAPAPLERHWELVVRAPVGDLDKLALLSAPTPAERLALLAQQLADLEDVLAARLAGE
jgi:Lon protease-like protein